MQTGRTPLIGETEQALVMKPQKWPLKTKTRRVIVMATKPAITATPTTMTLKENRPTRSTYQ